MNTTLTSTRQTQGLPLTISDPSTLAKIAALISLPLNGDAGNKTDRRQRKEARTGGTK
jgi:hypothetical protein